MDLFVVPISFKLLLYGFLIVRIVRRDLVWINVTTNPTAEWIARQITEAFPWDDAPGYMIRDHDCIYGAVVTRRLRAMGIRDKPIVPASPWQNGIAERLIGSIRRECLDHAIIGGEAHLRRVLKSYADYYNRFRTHRSLKKDNTGLSLGTAHRCHSFTRHPGRTSSPLWSDLNFRYTQVVVDAVEVREKDYVVWDDELPGFGLRACLSPASGAMSSSTAPLAALVASRPHFQFRRSWRRGGDWPHLRHRCAPLSSPRLLNLRAKSGT
jgi:hypothetical protein